MARSYDVDTLDYIQARAGVVARLLVWITARNLDTGLPESFGLWTGEENRAFVVDAQSRDYVGAGVLLEMGSIKAEPGLDVRTWSLALAGASSDVEAAVKGFDTTFAPVEVHRVLFDPENGQQVGSPHRVFRGKIDNLDFQTGPIGDEPVCQVNLVSATRELTRTLALKKSAASHALRGADQFRRYGDISGTVPVFWGIKKSKVAE